CALSNPKDRHELVRRDVKQVVCAVCDTEQQVAHVCANCGVKMGEYFCEICKFYDDAIEKQQFHCDDCGICRVGGRENFFHCQKCEVVDLLRSDGYLFWLVCTSSMMSNGVGRILITMDLNRLLVVIGHGQWWFLFDSVKGAQIMKCGHTMHMDCYIEMIKQKQYRCPICSKSALNMSLAWEGLDEEIEATPMPEDYRREVPVLCNDCNATSSAWFHILGHKCSHCGSYNTRVIMATATDDHQ
ncbi:hypothetical protein RJ640_019858, partial [Escallonia rubra]